MTKTGRASMGLTGAEPGATGTPHRLGSQAERSMRTRQRILEAAHAVFVREGFVGAKIEHIAEAAKTNKRLVYHHFGGKDELFRVVIENAYAAMRAAEQGLGLERLPPRDAITTLVRFTWTYYLEHEDFISLVAIENLCKAEHIASSERLPKLRSSLVGLLTDIIQRGEASGDFRTGIDPVQFWISIAAMCWFSVANKHTIAATFGSSAAHPAVGEERLAHILSVVHAFLAPMVDKPAGESARRA